MSNPIVYEFINKTKLCNMGESGRQKKLPKPDFELNPESVSEIITLPDFKTTAFDLLDVVQAIENRSSIREYSTVRMTLNELSFLLWCTQGIKRIIPNVVVLRNVPSAGARNAFETFLLINNVEGLESGLYKYVAMGHKLLKIAADEKISDELSAACDEQDYVKNCGAAFFWTAVPDRMTWSYADRGYRYLFIEAGHVCQNLYLAAEKLKLGVCAIGHFDDDRVNTILGIDGVGQFSVYVATVGKKDIG